MATGWDKMSDVDDDVDVQVYPVLEKKTDGTYVASDLAGVILFEAEPDTVAADYMLVLSANAIGKISPDGKSILPEMLAPDEPEPAAPPQIENVPKSIEIPRPEMDEVVEAVDLSSL